MVTGDEEHFGEDDWPDEAGPPGPEGTEGNSAPRQVYQETKKSPRKPVKKKTSRKATKESSSTRVSAQDALKILRSQEVAGPTPSGTNKPGTLGKFSFGKGNLNNPAVLGLVNAIIALVIAVAVCMYVAPTKSQTVTLTNLYNTLNSSVSTWGLELQEKLDEGDLEVQTDRVDDLFGITTNQSSLIRANENDITELRGLWTPNRYLNLSSTFTFGGISSGNVSGNFSYIMGNYWTKWNDLSTDLSDLDSSVNISIGEVTELVSNLSDDLESSVSDLYTAISGVSDQTFTVGNCSDCTLTEVLQYIYEGSRYGNW